MSKLERDKKLDPNSLPSSNAHEKVKNWIEEQDLEDIESLPESSVVDSSDNEYDGFSSVDYDDVVTTTDLGTTTEITTITESLKEMLNTINSVQTVGNINIENSTGVHIGNITNINGNIQIIHAGNGHQQNSFRPKRHTPQLARKAAQAEDLKTEYDPTTPRSSNSTTKPLPRQTTREERVNKGAFIEKIGVKLPRKAHVILPRSTWLAQRPMEDYTYMQEPVEYVIISHTATESSERQAINIRTTRDIQCFHIESREWNDIAYNFLVGCDANIYEGRGWGVVGAHTRGYNVCALGISFIGCFMLELPPPAALEACKFLLKKGVEDGHIAADYKLLCHCQCSPTESPGRQLYEEIQTWEHFYNPEQ